jgi:hypothetical protein
MVTSTNPHREQEAAMKHSVTKTVALFAALVVSTAASAATYDYTAHYDYIRKPQLSNAQIDSQIHEDTVACDNIVGVQQGKPSTSYRSCMLQRGWKYSFLSRTWVQASRAPADPYFSSNVKLAPGHYINHDSGMDCRNEGGAEVCDGPQGTVHYFDPDQDLPCTRTGLMSICTNM